MNKQTSMNSYDQNTFKKYMLKNEEKTTLKNKECCMHW